MHTGMILGYIVLLALSVGLLMRDMVVNDALRARIRATEREADRERAEKLQYKIERDTALQRDEAKRSHECRIRDDEIQRLKDKHRAEIEEIKAMHQKEMEDAWRENRHMRELLAAAEKAVNNLMNSRQEVA